MPKPSEYPPAPRCPKCRREVLNYGELCPDCGRYHDEPHADNCGHAALLARARELDDAQRDAACAKLDSISDADLEAIATDLEPMQ